MQDFGTTIDAREILEFEAGLPQTIIIGGTTYACAAGASQDAVSLEDDGFTSPSSVTVIVRRSLFASKPAALTTATYAGRQHRIETVQPSEDGLTYTLTLSEVQK